MDDIPKILNLFKLAGKLKRTERTGWVTRVQINDPESVADHSFRTAFIGMIVGEIRKVDSSRLVRMLLIHDLGEALIGDFDSYAKKKLGEKYWREKQMSAMHGILFENLPKKMAENYYDLWTEFENQETDVSKLARQVDKLELMLQAMDYESEGYPKEKFDVFWENKDGALAITDPEFKKLLELGRKKIKSC